MRKISIYTPNLIVLFHPTLVSQISLKGLGNIPLWATRTITEKSKKIFRLERTIVD